MGFLRPGQKKQIVLERRPGKPGRTFLIVEYIVAPSGYDPRMPFVEGAEVGRVKIRIRAYKDQKIPDTVPNLQGQAVTRRGQKFQAPAVIDDEKIEREIEELFAKKEMPHPLFELDDRFADIEEEDDEGNYQLSIYEYVFFSQEFEIYRPDQRVDSPAKLTPSEKKKKAVMNVTGGGGAVGGAATSGAIDAGVGGGAELIERIKKKVEDLSRECETMQQSITEQQRKVDKLNTAVSDLSYMKILLVIVTIIFITHILSSRS
uniref:MSP domain-containing protein n=1 Tax=Setaria digitata TaxID=48799 RepID=A0A915Q066_9BILA